MNRYLFGGGLALLFLFLACDGQQRYSWEKRYRRDYREPYDLYALSELLGAGDREVLPVRDSLQLFLPTEDVGAGYLFVGDQVYLADEEWVALYGWVAGGNTAFLSCGRLPGYPDRILRMYADCFSAESQMGGLLLSDSVRLTAGRAYAPDPVTCEIVHLDRFRPTPTDWAYLESPYNCELETVEKLGYLNGEWANFFRFAHGDGYIYIHLAPEAFTNYHLRDSAVFRYADACLSVLGDGPLYWDEFHKSPYRDPSPDEGNQRLLRSNHALRYVLGEPPLAAGWYLLVALAILFVLFRAKRRQAVVPVRPPRRNTSYEYLSDIGQLYYQSSNHRKLAAEQRKLFERHLRERYGLSYRDDAAFAEELAGRTGITAEQAEHIQAEIRHLESASADFGAGALLRFYRALEVVYLRGGLNT